MNCVSCGLPSGYNRVLVEQEDGTEVGGLCIECEEHRFGDRLDWGLRVETEPDRCVLCAREASIHAPEWAPEMEPAPDGTAEWSEYRVTDTTPGLCEEHLGDLVDSDPENELSPRTTPRQSR